MRFPSTLYPATLRLRHKRFLAEMTLPDGREITAHCPNPGAMTGLAEPGTSCWIAPAARGAKLDWGWKLARMADGAMVVIDTGIANRIVAEALEAGIIEGLPPHDRWKAEVRLDADSRIDFRLDGPEGPVWMEVKSVSLGRPGSAAFPDSRTARGTRHLQALQGAVERGERAVMLYLLVRDDRDRITIARDIDPDYARAFDQARAAGVIMLGMACRIDQDGVTATGMIPVE